jgi:hypothetical protein
MPYFANDPYKEVLVLLGGESLLSRGRRASSRASKASSAFRCVIPCKENVVMYVSVLTLIELVPVELLSSSICTNKLCGV